MMDGPRQQGDQPAMTDDVSKRHAKRLGRIVSLLVSCPVADAEDPRPEPASRLFRRHGGNRGVRHGVRCRSRRHRCGDRDRRQTGVGTLRRRRAAFRRCGEPTRARQTDSASGACRRSRWAACRWRSIRCKPSTAVRRSRLWRRPRHPGSLRWRACPTAGRPWRS